MFHMPMSSPMITTMFGFGCAAAGAAISTAAANSAMRTSNPLRESIVAFLLIRLYSLGNRRVGECAARLQFLEAPRDLLPPVVHDLLGVAPLPLRGGRDLHAAQAPIGSRGEELTGHGIDDLGLSLGGAHEGI